MSRGTAGSIEPLSFSIDPAVPRLTGAARRRVVVETARRLTALGGDILKAEFPYDPGTTDRGAWRDACAELESASRVPWVLLSGGVDDATFEAQVRVACEAGASGVLVGRSVWAEAATLGRCRAGEFPGRRPGDPRLARLVDLVDELGSRPGMPGPVRSSRPRSPVTAGTAATPSDRPGTGRMTSERRFDLLVAGELNPDILIVDPTTQPGIRPGRESN